MRPLTKNQKRVLDFLRQFIADKGFAPTQAEIARGLGFRSANAAAEHLRLLARKGVLQVTPGQARSIRILADQAPPAEELWVIGQVAAGEPIFAEANVEATLPISPGAFSPAADYLLRVRGDSMIGRGICPGDLLAVHRTSRPKNGDIAVVRLGQDVTVKTWQRHGDHVLLEPANPRFQPIAIHPTRDECHIEGRVVGLLRLGIGTAS